MLFKQYDESMLDHHGFKLSMDDISLGMQKY